jgi:hypothetical protein
MMALVSETPDGSQPTPTPVPLGSPEPTAVVQSLTAEGAGSVAETESAERTWVPQPSAEPTALALRVEPTAPVDRDEPAASGRSEAETAIPWQPWIRIGEFLLLGAALTLGGLTILLSRRH